MNISHKLASYKDVDGYLSEEDAATLQECARATAGIEGEAIEIGAYKGLSAVVLLDALPKDKKLISVDINTYPEFGKAIQDYGHSSRSRLTISGFREYDFNQNKYSLAFIDHNHEYEDNVECFKRVLPNVSSGGFILFHDVGHKAFPGVEKAVNEIVRDCGSVKLVKMAFTAVFQKL
jgi:predicted O-methyltransferase YrrM